MSMVEPNPPKDVQISNHNISEKNGNVIITWNIEYTKARFGLFPTIGLLVSSSNIDC